MAPAHSLSQEDEKWQVGLMRLVLNFSRPRSRSESGIPDWSCGFHLSCLTSRRPLFRPQSLMNWTSQEQKGARDVRERRARTRPPPSLPPSVTPTATTTPLCTSSRGGATAKSAQCVWRLWSVKTLVKSDTPYIVRDRIYRKTDYSAEEIGGIFRWQIIPPWFSLITSLIGLFHF